MIITEQEFKCFIREKCFLKHIHCTINKFEKLNYSFVLGWDILKREKFTYFPSRKLRLKITTLWLNNSDFSSLKSSVSYTFSCKK